MHTLEGKRVLITGAASGIGRQLARRFAASGAQVIAADIDGEGAGRTAAELVAAGAQASACVMDVTNPAQVRAARERINADGGPIDVLVNNAGVVFGGPFLSVPIERHLATYRVNTEGLAIVTHVFLPDLIARPEAHLVTVASASSFVGLPFGASYGASKWAALGFSESLRLELRELGHVHVGLTAVCPSYVGTGMFDGVTTPRLTRMLTPERVADLTVRAVLAGRAWVLTPWLVKVTPFLRGVLPRQVFDAVARAFGVNTSMTSWHGRDSHH